MSVQLLSSYASFIHFAASLALKLAGHFEMNLIGFSVLVSNFTIFPVISLQSATYVAPPIRSFEHLLCCFYGFFIPIDIGGVAVHGFTVKRYAVFGNNFPDDDLFAFRPVVLVVSLEDFEGATIAFDLFRLCRTSYRLRVFGVFFCRIRIVISVK